MAVDSYFDNFYDYSNDDDSDEMSDNEETSYERGDGEHTEIREQMYQDKLLYLKRLLSQLNDGVLPEWTRKLRRLENIYEERIRANLVVRDLEMEMIEISTLSEEAAALREFEENKGFLREQLIAELEEKQKLIETERHNMELTGDSTELKPLPTRKLRRRAANEPSAGGSGGYGADGKRRKPVPMTIYNLLQENEISEDLKIINKNISLSNRRDKQQISSASDVSGSASSSLSDSYSFSQPLKSSSPPFSTAHDSRIEDGKLFYEKRWFRRGQSVQVEKIHGASEAVKYPATISAIGSEAIWVRKMADNSKQKISLTQLTKGHFILKRRAV